MIREPEFRFSVASGDDEPELRALVGSVVMPGSISVRFEREPDYFLGTTVLGDPCDVLIARHVRDGALAAVAVRAERRVYLAGQEARVAYIGQIRVAPRFRARWLMQQAVLHLGQLREPTIPSFGVIATDNPVALGTLAGRRPPGAARVTRVARLISLAFVLHDRFAGRRATLPSEPVDPAQWDEVTAFLRREGPRRNLFPVVEARQLTDGRTYRGLEARDLFLVRRDGELAGVLGTWSQAAFKQEVVAALPPWLRRLRPGYDLAARILGARPLPRPGQPIRTAFGCLRCLAGDDPDVLRALLAAARERALRKGEGFLMLGFDECDPQLPLLPRTLHVTYRSEVFLGTFGGDGPAERLDDRPAYVEIGAL